MLENIPRPLGKAMQPLRAGLEKTVSHQEGVAGSDSTLSVSSSAFEDGAALPARFTEDGEGTSPPLRWSGSPPNAAATLIVVEDADSPTPAPIVHLIAWTAGGDGELAEGAVGPAPTGAQVGHNSFHKPGWLPPDPPTGHGPHRYVFQVFALDAAPHFNSDAPGKHEVLKALEGHVLTWGVAVGVYKRP